MLQSVSSDSSGRSRSVSFTVSATAPTTAPALSGESDGHGPHAASLFDARTAPPHELREAGRVLLALQRPSYHPPAFQMPLLVLQGPEARGAPTSESEPRASAILSST